MPVITTNNIEIAYRDHGPSGGPVLLLIQGLGMPLNGWPSDFIDLFVDSGIRVITFDNRDVGKSTILDHLGVANFKYLFFKFTINIIFIIIVYHQSLFKNSKTPITSL